MIGLGYILLFWLYFVMAKFIVCTTINWAKRHKKNTAVCGGVATFVMFSLIFWDLIPIYGIHSYKCATEGGLTIYKTLDEWKLENPGIAETLISENSGSIDFENTTRYHLNQRFDWDSTTSQVWDIIYKKEEQIIDTKTGEILAKKIEFNTSLKNPFISPAPNVRTYKIWLGVKSCNLYGNKNKWLVDNNSFYGIYKKYKYINGDK